MMHGKMSERQKFIWAYFLIARTVQTVPKYIWIGTAYGIETNYSPFYI